jgi:hypothetical protein
VWDAWCVFSFSGFTLVDLDFWKYRKNGTETQKKIKKKSEEQEQG